MNFLKKIFEQKDKISDSDSTDKIKDSACKNEQELVERFGGIALDKQRNLSKVIGELNWGVNMAEGTISFGTELHFPMQVLGSFSHASETWLWAWANQQSNIPENLLKQATALKNYGEKNGIDLLMNSEFDAQVNDLHLIGMVASGMFDSSAYYLANYGQGTLVVTFNAKVIDAQNADDQARISTVFPELISLFEMNHKNALSYYLSAKGYKLTEKQNKLTGVKNGNKLTAEFDDLFRMTSLNG